MDRLFLRALVDELRPEILGRRIRAAVVDRSSSLLYLKFAPPRPPTLVLSFLREAPGGFLLEVSRPPREAAASAALKKLSGSRVAGIEIADQDRVVTLSIEGTRLSGKATASKVILEALGTRAAIYLVEAETASVVEAFSSSRARLGAGESYQPPRAPPSSGPLAASASEVEERLAGANAQSPAALLAATGATPLVVREIEWLVARKGLTAGEAFMRIRSRLDEKRSFLYVPGPTVRNRRSLLSPLELASERELEPRELPSFSEAMGEAVALETEFRRLAVLRSRLGTAVGRRLDRARRLEGKLRREENALEEPTELRRNGELLLATLSRARRAADGKSVVLPDLFHSEEKEIEIQVDPRLSLPKNAERLFIRARRAERTRVELEKRLEAVAKEISFWEGFECDLRDATSVVELEDLDREALEEGLSFQASARPSKGRATVALGPRSFRSHRGSAILVGRSGRSNDELTFDVAKPRDLWFHASGVSGAHVVLRVAPGERPDEREVREAAELAAYYSKARESAGVDVIMTERRHLSRIKGAPRGTVKISPTAETTTLRVAPHRPENDSGNV